MESFSRPCAPLTSDFFFNVTVRKGFTHFAFRFFALVDVQTVNKISATNPNSSIFSDLQDVTRHHSTPLSNLGGGVGGGGEVGVRGLFPV